MVCALPTRNGSSARNQGFGNETSETGVAGYVPKHEFGNEEPGETRVPARTNGERSTWTTAST